MSNVSDNQPERLLKKNASWKKSVKFTFDDWGWVVINLGMGIGAGIAFLPIEVGIQGFWIFIAASVIGYPSMFLFQRLFINTLSEADSCNEYEDVIAEYLGRSWGTFIGFLYFIMLIIWFFVYSEAITKDSASYLLTYGVTQNNLSGNIFYIAGILSLLIYVASKGEKLLFKLSSVLAITSLAIILSLGLVMIPQWNMANITQPPPPVLFTKDTIICLPFVLTSILFLQSLSPMVVYFKKNSPSVEVARYRGQRAMLLAFSILFVIVFFYVLSYTFSLSHAEAEKAFKENISALAAAARGTPSIISQVLEVLLSIFAICACFLSIFLGLQVAAKNLLLKIINKIMPTVQINETGLKWGVAVFLLLLGTINSLLDIPILYFTLICSPIFGLIGCLIPAVLVYRVPKLYKYRGVQLYCIIAVGILLCLSPILALVK